MPGQDRREHPRVPYGAWIEDVDREGSIRFYLSKNLSLGGMLLAAEDPPPIGARLRLKLVVEGEKRTMTMEGEVVRHSPGGKEGTLIGVRFVNMDDERNVFLQDLVREAEASAGES